MNMKLRLPVAFGVMVLPFVVGGCDSEEQGMAFCMMAPTIAFDGREYIAVNPRHGRRDTDVRVDKRLGVGNARLALGSQSSRSRSTS